MDTIHLIPARASLLDFRRHRWPPYGIRRLKPWGSALTAADYRICFYHAPIGANYLWGCAPDRLRFLCIDPHHNFVITSQTAAAPPLNGFQQSSTGTSAAYYPRPFRDVRNGREPGWSHIRIGSHFVFWLCFRSEASLRAWLGREWSRLIRDNPRYTDPLA